MKANVINASWGGGAVQPGAQAGIDAAGAANVLFVAAAGNNGVNTVQQSQLSLQL